MAKADQFAEAASLFVEDAQLSGELSDAYVTLAIFSGIASSDVLSGLTARYLSRHAKNSVPDSGAEPPRVTDRSEH